MQKRIHLCLAHMSGNEMKFIQDAFNTNWVVPLGPNVNGFEQDLDRFLQDSHPELAQKRTVALSSGTAAIHLALVALGVQPGDEVLCQSFTFCASAHPVTYVGATPVFIDSEQNSWNIDPLLLDEAIKKRTETTGRKPKAVIAVHLYGMPAQLDRILEVTKRHKIPLIEDAAEGFGTRYNGKQAGTFGDFGVLSFNGNKMITTSGGGALICPDEETKQRVMYYATQAREAYPYYQHEHVGFNYRLSNICAGIGRGQMTVLDSHIAHHRHLAHLYAQAFAATPGIEFHDNPSAHSDSNFWLNTITLSPSLRVKNQEKAYSEAITTAVGGAAGTVHKATSAHTDCEPNPNVEAMRKALDEAGVESRPLWKPMHKQPVYASNPAFTNGVSEHLFKTGLCLPSGPMVTESDAQFIVQKIKENII
ncbi:MAG: aminotransferase class I/II-fold pyridoxal phosphate-dependent enzyme [Prevotella micans]|nr:aminotransferase class I/II-fold pyridoxal phosphate-dependent enzyme [Prevotella micans]